MPINHQFARQLRLRRLRHTEDRGMLVVPLDHSVTAGPITADNTLDRLVGQLAGNGVDAVVLHKGSLRYVSHHWFTRTSLIVHLSASTVRAPDPDAKYLVAGVEEALRLGADAVSVHVNLGSLDEQRQIADMATVADACDRWNVPLLAMMYPRGPQIDDPQDPTLVAHAATLAADLGADLVKTTYVGSVTEMADVTASCPLPVIVAGGPPLNTTADVLSYVDDALHAGAAGVAMGRNIFQAPEPGVLAGRVAERIHARQDPYLPDSPAQIQLAAS